MKIKLSKKEFVFSWIGGFIIAYLSGFLIVEKTIQFGRNLHTYQVAGFPFYFKVTTMAGDWAFRTSHFFLNGFVWFITVLVLIKIYKFFKKGNLHE